MILGLDVSTSFVGATVLNNKNEIVCCEAWDLRKIKNIFSKAEKVKNELTKLQDIDEIYIEQSLQAFRSGFSSANTLSTLSRFNGIISWMCYDLLKIEPKYLSASSARKQCGIKVPRGEKAKEVVLKFLLDNEPDFDIEYTIYENPKPGMFDRADSLIIARAGWIQTNSKS